MNTSATQSVEQKDFVLSRLQELATRRDEVE